MKVEFRETGRFKLTDNRYARLSSGPNLGNCHGGDI